MTTKRKSRAKEDPKFKRVRQAEEPTAPAKMGRPCLLTPALQERIVKLVQVGNYLETSARAVGISKKTLFEWLARGNKGEQPFADFRAAVEAASAEAETIHVSMLARAAQAGQVSASQWWLERRFPKRYGRRIEVAGDGDNPIGVQVQHMDLRKLSTEKLKALKAIRDEAAVSDDEAIDE